jgi:GTPase SAR1 family protein
MDGNIWELYGISSNPFTTEPLLIKGGILRIECFVGREQEQSELERKFNSSGSSRILIIGDVGVGKTSFVNYARFNAIKEGYFTPIPEIAVLHDWDALQFVVNTLYAIYITIKNFDDHKGLISKPLYKKLESLFEINLKSGYSIGLDVAGFGGNYGQSRTAPVFMSYKAVVDLTREVIIEIYNKREKELIIHYNNLERIDSNDIIRLFGDLRDFFQTPHVNFIFVGNLVTNNAIQGIPQVSSIFSEPIILKSMSYDEVKKIIDVRLNKLKIEGVKQIKPFDNSALKMLFGLYNGNIRHILNSLDKAVTSSVRNIPIVLDDSDVARILSNQIEEKYLKGIKPRAKDVLLKIVQSEEITNKGISDALKMPRPQVSIYLSDLKNSGCIVLRRQDGKDKFWASAPHFKWLLLKKPDLPEDLNQKLMPKFMK